MKRFFLTLSLACLPWFASAGSLHLAPAAGNHVAILQSDSQVFANAMNNRLVLPDAATVRTHRVAMGKVRREINNFTLAHFEYTYTQDGVEQTLVLHGRSGKPLETIFDDVKFTSLKSSRGGSGASGSATSDGPGGSSDDGAPRGAYELTPAEIERDAADSSLFPPDTAIQRGVVVRDVRTPRIPEQGSTLKTRITAARGDHSYDAELMNLRYYGREIDAGRLPRGGRLTGVVSQTPCESCQYNMKEFADQYDVDVDIRYLVEPDASGLPFLPLDEVAPPTEEAISLSRAASFELKRFRRTYTRNLFHQTRKVWQPLPATSWASSPAVDPLAPQGAAPGVEACE